MMDALKTYGFVVLIPLDSFPARIAVSILYYINGFLTLRSAKLIVIL